MTSFIKWTLLSYHLLKEGSVSWQGGVHYSLNMPTTQVTLEGLYFAYNIVGCLQDIASVDLLSKPPILSGSSVS